MGISGNVVMQFERRRHKSRWIAPQQQAEDSKVVPLL